jgi:fructose-1,6-bisphosphatase/inositol monophosphatase family enzyme
MISIQRIIEAVRKGMAVIREAQQRPRSGAKVKPGDGSLVTDTDKQVEKLLHECLKGIPDTRFLG